MGEGTTDSIVGEASCDHYANCQENNRTHDTTEATQIRIWPGATLTLTCYCTDDLNSSKEAHFYSEIEYQVLKK